MNRALILAGGEGLRLRPLTCTKPKAMLPVCGAPIISYTLDTLKRQGFKSVLIAADRLSNVLTDNLDGSPDVDFIISSSPEGTCRALSKAAEVCGGEDIAVISGSLLFDTDLNAAAAAHREAGADITVVTVKTDRPAEYAAAVTEKGFVTDIIPDPARESCISDLAVTGIFIVSSKAAKNGFGGDILTELIPETIKQGGKVLNFTAEGTFIGVDTPEDLFAAARAVFEGKIRAVKGTESNFVRKREERPELDISVPAYIAGSSDIAPRVKIGSGTVIGKNVTVCRGAELNGAVVMDSAYIGERVTVTGAVVGSGARLLADSSVSEGAVVGDGAVVGEQAEVRRGVKIWNGIRVGSCAHTFGDIKQGSAAPLKIGEDGICGETGSIITPQTAALAGSSLASLAPLGGRIGIAYRDDPASKSLALAIASGVTAAGAEAWLFGAASAPAVEYCTAVSRLSAGCTVDAGITARIRFCSGDGMPLSRKEEKLIENGINRGEYRREGFSRFGALRDAAAITHLYRNMLEGLAPAALNGIRAVLNTPGKAVSEVCGGIFDRINDKNGEPIVFHIGSDGRGASAYTEETGYVFEEKLILICCRRRFEQGLDVALPYDFPQAADRLAKQYGRRVLRYSLCPSDSGSCEARKLALETPFVRDGSALALSVLEALSRSGRSLAEEIAELPEMALAARFIAVGDRPAQLLRRVCCGGQATDSGIIISDGRSRAFIRPVKTEKGILMKAESYSVEAASELCDFYQEKLKLSEAGNK